MVSDDKLDYKITNNLHYDSSETDKYLRNDNSITPILSVVSYFTNYSESATCITNIKKNNHLTEIQQKGKLYTTHPHVEPRF